MAHRAELANHFIQSISKVDTTRTVGEPASEDEKQFAR